MRVLVVGGGGREHALVHSFAQSTLADRIFCAPGNAGTAGIADNIGVGAEDLPALLDFASREQVDLTVVGPEAPLVAGICDLFEEHGLAVFGPNRDAAQLEGSKTFAKEVMREGGVAAGAYSRHETPESALAALSPDRSYPLVVKAGGQAVGKGVIICNDLAEARAAVESCFVARDFGAAGDVVIIEEFLAGSEVSLLVLCDGRNAVPLAPAQDYKRIFAGASGTALRPSQRTSRETSEPARNSSMMTTSPAAPKSRATKQLSTAALASARSLQMMTPLPAARPSALTTSGYERSGLSAASADSGVSWRLYAPAATPPSRITSLAKALLPSSCAASRLGPKTARPCSSNRSQMPATSGASGPTTVRSTCSRLAKSRSAGRSSAPTPMLSAIPAVPALPVSRTT